MAKRALDVAVGTLLALLVLPLIVVLAIAVAVEFRAWPFFVHERIGEGGRPLRFVKLRSLPPSTPKYATKDRIDVEVSRFGRLLRRTHLDELPQLFLVIGGQLSLVGPRPGMPEEYEPVDAYYRRTRLTVPQGCTGLWQIGTHTYGLPSEAPEYDFFYVENASVRLDLLVLWWTGRLMVGLGRARSLDDVPRWALRERAPLDVTAALTTGLGVVSPGPIPLASKASAASVLSDGGVMTTPSA